MYLACSCLQHRHTSDLCSTIFTHSEKVPVLTTAHIGPKAYVRPVLHALLIFQWSLQAGKASSPPQIAATFTEAVPPPKDHALTAVNKADSPDSHSPDIMAIGKQAVTAEAAADAPFQTAVMELGRPLDMEIQVAHEL